MHIDKYKSSAIKNMINHYERGSESVLNRENIDRSRTHLNWTINKTHDLYREVHSAVSKIQTENSRKLRKDANWLSDVVLTKPENVPAEDIEKFFKSSAQFIFSELSKNGLDDNAPRQAYIHMDETTPHMHLSFCPIYNNDGKRTVSHKKIFTRALYRSIHSDLQRHLTPILGYKPAVLLEGEQTLKSLNKNDQKQFKRLKNEMVKQEKKLDRKIEVKNNQIERKEQKLKEVLDEKKVLNGELTLSEKENEKLAQQIEDFWNDYSRWEQKLEQLNNKYEKLTKQSYWVRKNTARDLLKEERELMLQGKNWNTVIYDNDKKQKKKQKRKNLKRKMKSLLR